MCSKHHVVCASEVDIVGNASTEPEVRGTLTRGTHSPQEHFDDGMHRLHQLASEAPAHLVKYGKQGLPSAGQVVETYSRKHLTVEQWKGLERRRRTQLEIQAKREAREPCDILHEDKALHVPIPTIPGLQKRVQEPPCLAGNFLQARMRRQWRLTTLTKPTLLTMLTTLATITMLTLLTMLTTHTTLLKRQWRLTTLTKPTLLTMLATLTTLTVLTMLLCLLFSLYLP